MPRTKDLNEELQLVKDRMAEDPSTSEAIICKVRLPVYKKIVESAIEHKEVLATHCSRIVTNYFKLQDTGGLDIDTRQLTTLAGLCKLWDCSPLAAVRKVFERAGEEVLHRETEGIQRNMAILSQIPTKK